MSMDWDEIFAPTLPLAEIVLRGSAVYLGLFFILRLLRRDAGSISISDLLVVVIIADAAQNAMGQYTSLTEGAVLVGTIMFWNYFLDWASFRFPQARWLLRAPPVLLIRDGRMLRRNMARELIEEDELRGQLREQGVERIEDVKRCYLESDGHISIIKTDAARD